MLVEGPKEVAYAGNATTGSLIGAAGDVNVLVWPLNAPRRMPVALSQP